VSAIPRLTFSLHMLFGLYARGGVVHVNDRHVDSAVALCGGQPRCALRFATKLPAEGSKTEIKRPTAVPTEWATHAGAHRCHGRQGAGGATLGVGEPGLGSHLVSVGISLLCITRSLAAWQPGSLAAWQPWSPVAVDCRTHQGAKAQVLRMRGAWDPPCSCVRSWADWGFHQQP
jgi:hypothetical protein